MLSYPCIVDSDFVINRMISQIWQCILMYKTVSIQMYGISPDKEIRYLLFLSTHTPQCLSFWHACQTVHDWALCVRGVFLDAKNITTVCVQSEEITIYLQRVGPQCWCNTQSKRWLCGKLIIVLLRLIAKTWQFVSVPQKLVSPIEPCIPSSCKIPLSEIPVDTVSYSWPTLGMFMRIATVYYWSCGEEKPWYSAW